MLLEEISNDTGAPTSVIQSLQQRCIAAPGLLAQVIVSKYAGWLTIEAFGRRLQGLVEQMRVWRDFFKHPDKVGSYRFFGETWNAD